MRLLILALRPDWRPLSVVRPLSLVTSSATRRKLTNLVTIPTELDIGPLTEAGKASGGKRPFSLQ